MVNSISLLCILIFTFSTAPYARPSSDGQHLVQCIFHHGMHPKHFIPRSKGAGVCMSIIENVGSTYLRSEKATRSTGKHRVELSMPRNSLELFLFMFGFHALYPKDATLSLKLE
jgi:hypothetical protein